MCHEFAVLSFDLDGVEVFGNFGHPVRVAYSDHRGGQFFGAKVDMVNSTPGVDDEF